MSRRAWWGLAAFAAASILIVAALDQRRPWKGLQLETLAARQDFLEAEFDETRASQEDEIRLRRDSVRIADEALRSRSKEFRELKRELFRLEHQTVRAERRLARATKPDAKREARLEAESYREMVTERRQRLDAMLVDKRDAEAELAAARQPLEDLQAELALLRRDAWWRALPGVRYLAPSLTVRELRPRGLGDSGTVRVERCTTCHLGMAPRDVVNRELATGVDSPATWPHPRPELVGTGTPHNALDLGCTSCHGGDGLATDLARAGHLPADPAMAERWRVDWGWRRANVDRPILSGDLVEAGCLSCHGQGVWIEGAPVQQRGRRLLARLGCAGCHLTGRADLDSAPPVGGDLSAVAAATTPAWVAAYLADPSSQIPGAGGPAFWENVPAAERDVEIAVLVTELWRRSQRTTAMARSSARPSAGDPEPGAQLFDALACGACHSAAAHSNRGLFASNLEGLAERRDAAWLTSFLDGTFLGGNSLDGRSAWRHRPDLRLSADEAAHLAAHLVAVPGSTAEVAAKVAAEIANDLLAIDPELRDRLLLASLEDETTIEAAQALLESLDEAERTQQLADRLFKRYSCAACHTLPDQAVAPKASDLRTAGTRLAARLESCSEPPATWLHTSTGAQSARVGRFELTPTDSRALFVQLLGWRGSAPLEPGSDRPAIALGRAVFERHACRACHDIEVGGIEADGGSPEVASSIAPPFGQLVDRLRADWLVEYLRDPSSKTVRPWLEARMPTFGLKPTELDAVVDYFVASAGSTATRTVAERLPADSRAEAVGQALFQVLQCGRCHGVDPDAGFDAESLAASIAAGEFEGGDYDESGEASDGENGLAGLPPIHPAPDYRLTSRRLRTAWVLDFLLDPHRVDPRAAMPPIFSAGPHGQPDATLLAGSLMAPMFEIQRQRLWRYFEDEDALVAYVSDAELVAQALRAHLLPLDPP